MVNWRGKLFHPWWTSPPGWGRRVRMRSIGAACSVVCRERIAVQITQRR
jgi:hypothetical protein